MPITSSQIIEDRVQVDGRRHVRERHLDHLGAEHLVSYMAEADDDVQALLALHAAATEERLAAEELLRNEREVFD